MKRTIFSWKEREIFYLNIKNLVLQLLTKIIEKSLTIRDKNFVYLIRLYEYKYKSIKTNFLINNKIINSHNIKIKCYKLSGYNKTFLTFIFSQNFFKNVNTMRRSKNCLDYWIPYLIQASNKANKNFSVHLDSSDNGNTDYLSMDSNNEDKLIPDLYSMQKNHRIDNNFSPLGFDQFKKVWLKKKNILYWRGSTTGNSFTNIQELNKLKRIQICNRYKNINGFDIKITRIVQNRINKNLIKEWLISENIYDQEIREDDFKTFKYYPDIPGNSLAWGTIHKYLLGNLIFKPDTKRKLFYYQFMHPWQDYIPVDHDFIDLDKKYEWVESHIEEASFIAWNGYIKAHNYIKKIPEYFNSILVKNSKFE